MCHVAGRGDTWAEDVGEWIAGPSDPSRIEGFAVEWVGTPPANVALSYGAKFAQRNRRGSSGDIVEDLQEAGNFVGTRGRALPLTGIQLALDGADARHYCIDVKALFLGSPVMQRSGTSIALAGPSGREPLVGLSVAIRVAAKVTQIASAASAASKASVSKATVTKPPDAKRSRVRVFRSSGRQVTA